jgi:hypothetical protein
VLVLVDEAVLQPIIARHSVHLHPLLFLLTFMVGGELGTMYMKYKDAKDSIITTQKGDLDMSGSYAKIFVGFGI